MLLIDSNAEELNLEGAFSKGSLGIEKIFFYKVETVWLLLQKIAIKH